MLLKLSKGFEYVLEKLFYLVVLLCKKIYNDDNFFFAFEKIIVFTTILYYVDLISVCIIIGADIMSFMITLLVGTVLLALFYLFSFMILFNDKKKKADKLTDAEWETLVNSNCYHLTSKENKESIDKGNSNILIKPTKYLMANLEVYFKQSAYFFLNKPDEKDIVYQNLQRKKDLLVTIPIKNMDRDRIRIRRQANVLIYIGGYEGEGTIKPFSEL